MSKDAPQPVDYSSVPPTAHVAVVAARFNAHIVEELMRGCVQRLDELGVTDHRITVHRVPGAFELPMAAAALARTKRFSAIICLGCVIRGDTPHFDFVAGECARGIQLVAITEQLPVIFGVLTTNTLEQAQARAGGSHSHAGVNSAEAAMEMMAFAARLRT